MLHTVADESLEEAALFIASRCDNINYTNRTVRRIINTVDIYHGISYLGDLYIGLQLFN